MIIGCVLSLIIGASLVSPMLLLNTVLNPFPDNPQVLANPQSSISQIGVNLKKVYVELGTINNTYANSTEPTILPAFKGTIVLSATKYLNNNQDIPDGEGDYFLIQIYSENRTAPIWNSSYYAGTAYTRSYFMDHQGRDDIASDAGYLVWNSFDKPLDLEIGVGSTVHYGWGIGPGFDWTWPIGTSIEYRQGWSGDIKQSIAAILADSQTLTMTLSRIGSITVRGNSTIATYDPGLIQTVQLVRQGNGFLYNQDGSSIPVSLSDR